MPKHLQSLCALGFFVSAFLTAPARAQTGPEQPAQAKPTSVVERVTTLGKPRTVSNIAGTGAVNQLAKWIDANNVTAALVWEVGGLVGVGTSAPEATLHLQQTNTAAYKIRSSSAVGTGRAFMQVLRGAPGAENGWDMSTNLSGALDEFSIRQLTASATTTRFVMLTNGNVGIGTTSPASTLDVTGTGHFTGNVTIDGNIAAKYQDVAEWVPAAGIISPGTVVVLSQLRSNEVTPSAHAYDTSVAGVVSAEPGIILGTSGPEKVKVATTGRVRVHVDAANSGIAIGDLLVTSGREGVAMKSEPVDIGGIKIHRPGTIVGKALESLAGGEGDILVLLTLQ